MNTRHTIIGFAVRKAEEAGILRVSSPDRRNFLARARAAYKRNLNEPGDCAGYGVSVQRR